MNNNDKDSKLRFEDETECTKLLESNKSTPFWKKVMYVYMFCYIVYNGTKAYDNLFPNIPEQNVTVTEQVVEKPNNTGYILVKTINDTIEDWTGTFIIVTFIVFLLLFMTLPSLGTLSLIAWIISSFIIWIIYGFPSSNALGIMFLFFIVGSPLAVLMWIVGYFDGTAPVYQNDYVDDNTNMVDKYINHMKKNPIVGGLQTLFVTGVIKNNISKETKEKLKKILD